MIIAFVIYLVAGTAETNRGPFDLPEADSELTAGYHTEYSGMHFGFFYLAEYLNLFIVAGVGYDAVPRRMDAAAHRRLGRLQRRHGFYCRRSSGFSVKVARGYFRHHVVQVDVPATEDRPAAAALEWKYLLPLNLLNLLLMVDYRCVPDCIFRLPIPA